MKKILGILDTQEVYIKHFVQYLKEEKKIGFEIQAFTEIENLKIFLEKNWIEIILISFAEFEKNEELIKEILKEKAKKVFLLAEEKETEKIKEYPVIYRYQPMKNLLQDIFSFYREEEKRKDIIDLKRKEGKLISIYSPIKRCQKTIFSLILSRILSENEQVLYVNLEEYSGFSKIFEKEYQADLADVLYYWKEKMNWEEQLENSLEKWKELSYIPPVRCPFDIKNMTAKEWREWFCSLLKREEFSYIVCDFGDGFPEMEQVLELSDKIYMPIKKDKIARAKVEEYEKYLSICGWEELKDKIYKVDLPALDNLEKEWIELEELYQGEYGRIIKTMKRELEHL